MNILDLKEGNEITITVNFDGNSMDFRTKVAGKIANTILVDEIMNDDKVPVSFAVKDIYIEAMSLNSKNQPIIWKNVVIRHITWEGKDYHRIAQAEDGKVTNRRDAYRLSVNKPAVVQAGINTKGIDVFCKDISTHGFSFICKEDLEFASNMIVRLNLEYDKTTINMNGIPVRKQKVNNKQEFIYACKTNTFNKGLDKFIMEKQREFLHNKMK